MLDRTDLQLMLCEQIRELRTDDLVELTKQLTGEDLEVYDREQDIVVGSIESLDIDDLRGLKAWLGFLLYALGERVEAEFTD